jgi:hypothetical protein
MQLHNLLEHCTQFPSPLELRVAMWMVSGAMVGLATRNAEATK